MDRNQLLERILEVYGSSYDIERCGEADAPMVAKATFHEHGTGYVLVKKAEMWTADRHEYAYIYSLPRLTKALAEQCMATTLALGEPLVEPKKGHMSTNLVSMILCDEAEPEALAAVKACRYRKSFQFSLLGWMEVQAVVAEVGKSSAMSNGAGRQTAKFLKNLFHPRKRTIFSRFLR